MKSPVSRLLTAIMFLAVLMSAPLALAQDPAPTAPADQAETGQSTTSGPLEAVDLPAAAPAPQPASGSAAAASSSPLSYLPGGGLDLLKGLGAFLLVLVVLYLFLKGLGRLGRFGGRRGRDAFFELRGIQALDNRKYLAALEVEGRIIVVGVTQDRITPVAQWIIEHEDDDIDLASAKLPADEPGLQFKLPEEDDLPLDISVADHHSGRPGK